MHRSSDTIATIAAALAKAQMELTRACLQLGELCARTEQNQTRNTVL
jgi:hypothetical protein